MLTTTLPLYLQDAGQPQARVCAACEVRRSALFGALDERSLAQIHTTIAAPRLGPDERLFGRGEPGLVWLPRREDMGAMLDMTVETASRLVSRLRRDGMLTLLPPRHARLDRARLAAALDLQDAG